VSGDTGRILAALERLEVGQADLRSDLMARIDRLQDSVTAIRDDIIVAHGAVDQAVRMNANTRDEQRGLLDIIMAMQKQISRLQTDMRDTAGQTTASPVDAVSAFD
jgi:hypothetical protein